MAAETLQVRLTGSVTRHFTLNVNLEVRPGERLALVGSNGAGKTSVLRTLAGLDRAAPGSLIRSGTTVLADDRTHLPPHTRGLPTAFAEPRLFPTMSILDNLIFGVARPDRPAARAHAQDALAALGLAALAQRRAGELSSGQCAIVAILRAVFARSVGVLLDEPFSALDATLAAEARSAVHSWLETLSVPLVMATHSPLDVMALATHVGVLDHGVLVQHGLVDEIARRPTSKFAAAFLGLNLFAGTADGRFVTLKVPSTTTGAPASEHHSPLTAAGCPRLTTAIPSTGQVWVAFAPQAITLHDTHPEGSAQNTWATTVAAVEQLGASVRVTCAGPFPAKVDVTPGAAMSLRLRPGKLVWASLKATGIEVYPA